MSDAKFRNLEKGIKAEPNNYILWGDYLREAVRLNLFDPYASAYPSASEHSLVYFLHQVTFPSMGEDESFDVYMQQNEAYNKAINETERLLHNIRCAYGQWSPSQFASHLDIILSDLLIHKPEIRVASMNEEHDEASSVMSVALGNHLWIAYDELEPNDCRTPLSPESKKIETTNNRGSKIRYVRSTVDFTPQYFLKIEKYFPGSRYEPPDSDIVDLFISADPHAICMRILQLHLDDAADALADEEYAEEFES